MDKILPKFHAPYKLAFEVQGEEFYMWDDIAALPLSRKFSAGAILDLRQLRISDDMLDKTLVFMEQLLDPSDGMVRVKDAMVLLHELRKRLQMLPMPKLILRLGVQLFFKLEDDFEEDLSPEEAERRYELFHHVKKKVIFHQSMLDITGLHSLSPKDLNDPGFLRQLELQQIMAEVQDQLFSG